MMDITPILIGIILLFSVFLALRTLFAINVCALCAAVSGAWITLLALIYLGYAIDPVFVALLVGGSAAGAMYLLEAKLSAKYAVFKLPFYLTLVWVAYVMLKGDAAAEDAAIIAVLWAAFGGLFFWRDSRTLSTAVKRIIECCKNW